MKKFLLLFCVVFLTTFTLVLGQLERFEDDEPEQEIEPMADRIGNGTVSEHVTFMASLRLKALDLPYGKGHICGAVFITRQHLLTAAVCIVRIDKDYAPNELEVVAGVRSRYDVSHASHFEVSRIYYREEYQRFPVLGMDGNLVILVLSSPVPDTINSIAPIEYTTSPAGVGAMCTIYGWGMSRSMEGSWQLMKGYINVVDRTECTTSYFNHFCAGPSNIGGCPGDDGGATVCDGILFGLVGWRYDDYCNETNNAHLYVDLAPYHEWIVKLTNKSSTAFPSLILVVFGVFMKFFEIL